MPFTPLASDGLGRRSSIVIGSVIMLGGVTMQACAKHVGTLIGARVISEFPITLSSAIAHQLVPHTSWIRTFVRLECCSTAHRGTNLPDTGLFRPLAALIMFFLFLIPLPL